MNQPRGFVCDRTPTERVLSHAPLLWFVRFDDGDDVEVDVIIRVPIYYTDEEDLIVIGQMAALS